jgi:hypothetical protein
MSHDPACFDLATIFLADDPELAGETSELAEHIQEAIEDWIIWKREKLEKEKT